MEKSTLHNQIMEEEHQAFIEYVACLETERATCHEYRNKMAAVLRDIEAFQQPQVNEKVMKVEMDLRSRVKNLITESLRTFFFDD